MALVNTHAGFVERWECDTNDHLNVRYYAKRFDEALEMLCALGGRSPVALTSRHTRFHRELRADAMTRVRSARVEGGPADGRIVHVLENADTGAIAATALDVVDGMVDVTAIAAHEVEAAMPRSVPLGPTAPEPDAAARLERGQATLSNVRVADPRSFDAAGRYLAFEYVSGFSDGGAWVWAYTGMSNDFMAERQWGRIAVESSLTVYAPVTPGMVLRQISWVPDVAAKSMAIVHQVDDVRTGATIARGDVRAMVLDFNTRRSAQIPDFVRERAG